MDVINFVFFLVQCDRLAGGLQKIAEASEQLAILNEKLAVQKVAVTEKTAACEQLLKVIATNSKQAIEKKKLAEAKGVEIAEQSKVIAVEKVSFQEINENFTHNLSEHKPNCYKYLTSPNKRLVSWHKAKRSHIMINVHVFDRIMLLTHSFADI